MRKKNSFFRKYLLIQFLFLILLSISLLVLITSVLPSINEEDISILQQYYQFIYFMILMIIIIIFISMIFFFRLHKRINMLKNAMNVPPGEHLFPKPVTVRANRMDEIDKLKVSFNSMVEKLEKSRKREIEEEFNSYQIEEEIKKILNVLSEDNPDNEEVGLEFNPITIDNKLNETIKPLTKKKIKNNVRDFFHIVKKEFKNIDAIKANKATLIAQQIKVFYLKTMDKNLNQEDIFNYLVLWLNKKTQISEDASSIVISYFIQNCEVFDVIPE